MAATTPMLGFLRPLGMPRPSTVRHFLRFSTATPCRATAGSNEQPREDRNLTASRTAAEAYPPPEMKSKPRPKESRASRRTAHPPKQRHYPTRTPSHHQPQTPKLVPDPVVPLAPEQCAPNLPYFVTRSAYNELPIYTLRKRGGNKLLTKLKNVDGDGILLRDELISHLGLNADGATVNSLTRHIIVKGHVKSQIATFLRERNF